MRWLSFALLVAFVVAAAAVSKSKNAECPFFDGIYTSVMRRIFNQGFHKNLSTEVELMWTTSVLPETCRLVIEETMPRGMYVDPDELRDLRDMTGMRTYVPSRIDVEKPEYESEAFRVLVFRPLETQENLRLASVALPVHLRYHKPDAPPPPGREESDAGASSPSTNVRIQNPRLLLSCDGEQSIASLCPAKMVTSYCDDTGAAKCDYLQIPYKINVNSVEVSVPVGNTDHTWHVVGVTTFVVSGGTIYLLVAMFRKVDHVA